MEAVGYIQRCAELGDQSLEEAEDRRASHRALGPLSIGLWSKRLAKAPLAMFVLLKTTPSRLCSFDRITVFEGVFFALKLHVGLLCFGTSDLTTIPFYYDRP